MERIKIAVMVFFVLLVAVLCCVATCSAHEVSVACMMAYDEGGARAVFSSQECPQWKWDHSYQSGCENTTANSGFAAATIQGRRDYQEDRIVCNPARKIPGLVRNAGEDGQELTIGIAAVFDGHAGAEASELASKKFVGYFFLNVVFETYKQAFALSNLNEEANHLLTTLKSSYGTSSKMDSETSLRSILKGALIKTFEDIDSEFNEEALKNGYESGSTGTVVLLVNGEVLVGYVGDSKALLCSDPTRATEDTKVTFSMSQFTEELTIDHNPNREDEKARIEASGGFIRSWGVPRVNGMLAMTRAIGDLSFRRYGVIAEPEVIGWRTLSSENKFLVVGTDGIFEGLTPSNVCAILNNNVCSGKNASSSNSSSCLALSTLAGHLVYSAFENGSNDNISVIVIPLESDDSSK